MIGMGTWTQSSVRKTRRALRLDAAWVKTAAFFSLGPLEPARCRTKKRHGRQFQPRIPTLIRASISRGGTGLHRGRARTEEHAIPSTLD